MKEWISLFLKGLLMGAANVIPGVSGGTIALITGIFERLVNALRRCDPAAAGLFFRGRLKDFMHYIDGYFLAAIMTGVVVSIVSLARLFEYLLEHNEVGIMSFFFGLILLSIFYVGKTVTRWTPVAIALCVLGIAIAVGVALLAPASENSAALYVFLCGVVAICSMILPGLSGSFVLIMMGNYALVLSAINTLNLSVLLPLVAGCAIGLIAFSHLLGWIFKQFHDQTVALMTGFVVGSLVVIWPWKNALTDLVVRDGKPDKEVIVGYEWFLPSISSSETLSAIGLMVAGAIAIVVMQLVAGRESH